jgi:2'-hydroxyisoflavone reductase
MRILVIGGTQFVGRAFVEAALARGHEVTIFHRGRTNPGVLGGVEEILGDRDGGLDALGARSWDAVLDTCGYVPWVVRASVEALHGRVERYAFVSTGSVYDDPKPGTDESGRLCEVVDADVEEITGETYGPLKVACEREVVSRFGARALVPRPGLIVGPHDPTDRFTYWPVRFARGGRVAVPANGDASVQFVDARDLGAWIVRALEEERSGPFNLVGPREPLTMRSFLDVCQGTVAPPGTERVELPDDFLEEHEVAPFVGLPMWLPASSGSGLLALDHRRVQEAGMRYRPLTETLRDTLEWHESRGAPELKTGLPAGREEDLLRAWLARA